MSVGLRLIASPALAPELEALRRELREVLADNERLLAEASTLRRQRDAALERVADLEADQRSSRSEAPDTAPSILILGRLRLNRDLRLLSLDGREVHLSKREIGMVAYLMALPDRVTPTLTLALVIGMSNENAVRVLMARIRAKLAELEAGRYLRNYGISWSGGGYWMSCDHETGGGR